MSEPDRVAVVDADGGPALALIDGPGSASAVVWPGMGAVLRTMHRISLGPAARTRRQRHPGEAVYYVISGSGSVGDTSAGASENLVEGSMVHVEPETEYELVAGELGLELVGGPSPADTSLYPPG